MSSLFNISEQYYDTILESLQHNRRLFSEQRLYISKIIENDAELKEKVINFLVSNRESILEEGKSERNFFYLNNGNLNPRFRKILDDKKLNYRYNNKDIEIDLDNGYTKQNILEEIRKY